MPWSPPPLPQTQPDWLVFQVWWQQVIEDIAEQFTGLEDVLAAQAGMIADIQTALTNAGLALDAATGASDLSALTARDVARLTSYTAPTNVLSSEDEGSDTSLTIAAHTRVYPGAAVADLAVAGGGFVGLNFGTTYYVYYDDTTLADATPSYQLTSNIATAMVGAAEGRHFVGVIITPADGAAPTTGQGGTPPGGGGGDPLP